MSTRAVDDLDIPVNLPPGSFITAWLALPPGLRDEYDTVFIMVNELIGLLGVHTDGSVLTSEPRKYRATERGRMELHKALQSQRISSFGSLLVEEERDDVSRFAFQYRFDDPRIGSLATVCSIRYPIGQQEALLEQAQIVANFVRSWFQRTNGTCGWISWQQGDGGDNPDMYRQTAYERTVGVTPLGLWESSRTYLRGVFWGNVLDARHCDILGGLPRVLQDAPAWKATPLENGIFLQASPTFPPDEGRLASLQHYLRPLLTWGNAEEIVARRERNAALQLKNTAEITPAYIELEQMETAALPPLRVSEGHVEADNVVNLHFGRSLHDDDKNYLRSLLFGWMLNPSVAESGVNYVSAETFDDTTMRFSFESKDITGERALQVARKWFSSQSRITVSEIVFGTEIVG